jgi:exonuclease SbcC
MEQDLAAIDAAWAGLGEAIPAEISARYRGAHALVLRSLDALQNPQSKNVPEPLADAAEPAAAPAAPAELPQTAVTDVLVSQARFDAALAAAQAQARVEQERRKALRDEIELLLPGFATAIESGDSASAHSLHARIREGLKSLRDAPAELHRRLAPLEEHLAEMKRWQHWSNNQRRRVLCTEIEALSDSGLHPDAIATRVREAREEWQRLDAAEGIATDSETGPGISRRFHALCYQVLRPTKGYFSKRNEVRKSHGTEIEALLERAAAIADDTTDWNALAALRTEASAALRTLDQVDPRTRTALAKRLKEVIARAGTLIQTHEREVEASKQRLIEQALALGSRSDHATLPREARDLQKRWTTLGNGRRAVDQRQWREFRSACDAVFGNLDAARKDRESQVAATLAQVQDIVTELESLARDESTPSESVKTQLRDLDARWQATSSDDRNLVQRQRQAHDALTQRIKDSARRKRLGRYTTAMQKYAFLRTIETGTAQSIESWDAFATTTPAFEAALRSRHALPAPGESEESEDAREILVQLEFLAGIDSPAEDRQRRMSYQVSRLSSRMRSGAAATPEQELDELLGAWFAQTPQPLPLEERFAQAATAVIDTLP